MKILPVRVAQAPQFLKQVWTRTRALKGWQRQRGDFHLCFFTCGSYFKYLYCAVDSIAKTVKSHDVSLHLFIDSSDPLSESQIGALADLGLPTVPTLWPKSMGWGESQICAIWEAYSAVALGAAPNAYVARVDSDVFFINERIFDEVVARGADLVGDGHHIDFKYVQGGCYFLSKHAVDRISASFPADALVSFLRALPIAVEDLAVFELAKELGLNIQMSWFMLFPEELRFRTRLGRWLRWKYSCIHFVMKNKEAMLSSYREIVWHGSPPALFETVLEGGGIEAV